MVELRLAKAAVEGSNPFSRSIFCIGHLRWLGEAAFFLF